MLGTHITNRIRIDQHTSEFVISISRVASDCLIDCNSLTLIINRRTCQPRASDEKRKITLMPYLMKDGLAYFKVPAEFSGACYHAGMYDALLMLGTCEVDRFEILKAPRPYVSSVHTHDQGCTLNKEWVEPDHCPVPPKPPCPPKEVDCLCPNMDKKESVKTVTLNEPL